VGCRWLQRRTSCVRPSLVPSVVDADDDACVDCVRTVTLPRKRCRTLTHTHAHTRTHNRSPKHTHTHTHTYTHINTHALPPPPPPASHAAVGSPTGGPHRTSTLASALQSPVSFLAIQDMHLDRDDRAAAASRPRGRAAAAPAGGAGPRASAAVALTASTGGGGGLAAAAAPVSAAPPQPGDGGGADGQLRWGPWRGGCCSHAPTNAPAGSRSYPTLNRAPLSAGAGVETGACRCTRCSEARGCLPRSAPSSLPRPAPGRNYEDIMDKFSLHQFIIRKGKVLDNTPEFASYRRTYRGVWGSIERVIE
jgi:hypothetical protein